MKVKIIKISSASYWYFDKLGQEFDVENYGPDQYQLKKDPWKLIDKKDCKILG